MSEEEMEKVDKLEKEVEKIAESKQKAEEVVVKDSLTLVQDRLLEQEKLNDKLEAEFARSEQLRAKKLLGGKAEAGEQPKNQENLDDEEAKRILSAFTTEE